MPLTVAPTAEGVTVHWSKRMPPIDVFVARLSAVIDVHGRLVR